MQELVETLDGWRAEGAGVGRAVVVRTFGSAPRPEGAVLLVTDDGRLAGSVSGGCVEGAVVGAAVDVIASGKPRMLEFGVADETAWRVGSPAGISLWEN
jgi:xanthine/CO dehydrogenase XdhC/CoxF family maturation factor